MPRIALCFPGQGSQAAGMADGLLDTALGRRLLQTADAAGLDLAAALAADDSGLRPTEVAQPALLLTEVVLASLLPDDVEVVAVAGHSVGEYAACATAGALSPEAALELVIARGRLMATMREGTMAAVLGLDADRVARICSAVSAGGDGTVVIANINAPGQVVISGTVAAVAAASAQAREAGAKRAVPLNVSGAFHSPLMADAAAGFAAVLGTAQFHPARVPVVGNVDAEPASSPDAIRERLRHQLEAPVRWVESVRRLADLGASSLVEVGPGGVLTGLARRIVPDLPAFSVSTPAAAAGLSERIGVAAGD